MENRLPASIEAEQGILGSILIDPEAIVLVADFLKSEHFYRNEHRIIYSAVLSLYTQHEPVDSLTLYEELERNGKIDVVGGSSYISSLTNNVPTSGNAEHYGRIVQKKSEKRELIRAAGMIAQPAHPEDTQAVDKCEEIVDSIAQGQSRARVSYIQDEV